MPKALRAPAVEAPLCQQNWEQVAGLFPIQQTDLALKFVFGYVLGATGAVGFGIVGSNDWTSARSAVGTYTTTFNTAFSATPVVVAVPAVTSGAFAIKVTAVSTTAASFLTYVTNTGTITDCDFMFLAIGAR